MYNVQSTMHQKYNGSHRLTPKHQNEILTFAISFR